jgi:hypothetical protein
MMTHRTVPARQTRMRLARIVLATALVSLGVSREAAAQLDPLLFLKRTQTNVLLLVETANRMQRDARDDYYDPNIYTKNGSAHEGPLGVTPANTNQFYRRKYVNLVHQDPSGGDRFSADRIEVVGDRDNGFATFEAKTRLSVARTALIEAIQRNAANVRFGLLRTRQSNPRIGAEGNESPVKVADTLQQDPTDMSSSTGKWRITRPEVDAVNGSLNSVTGPLVSPSAPNANTTVLGILGTDVRVAGALVPGGRDAKNTIDAPVDALLEDALKEASSLGSDVQCRNTVAILVTGGGEGTTSGGRDPVTRANQFVTDLGGRRVPVYVIAIAPSPSDASQLQQIASESGGVYTEIKASMIDAVAPGTPVPEFVRAVNFAVQHTLVDTTTFNKAPTVPGVYGLPPQEYQVTSPIVGTVNLDYAKDIAGLALGNTVITHPVTKQVIPQRSNLLVTTGFELPGFYGRLRGFRVYEPVADKSKPSGYRFESAGTRLWVASAPAAASRNIYTVLPDGTVLSVDASNAAALQPYLNTTDPVGLIDFLRNQPLGAVVSSTPAIMDAPSLDPPPDSDYPGYAVANKARRSLIWVGANDGMLHAIDARLGVEVWAFIPFNLLPKLKELRSGQPVTDFRYFVDSSPKMSDVKVNGKWRTYLVIGEGAGGTFYQTLDVTLDNMASSVMPTDDTPASVLAYFKDSTRVGFKWSFPRYSSFDHTIAPWGDVSAAATALEKTVGETWSDPAIGQIETAKSKFTVLVGSGFLKYSVQQQTNRKVVAGTTFFLIDAENGQVFDSDSVGSDGLAEDVDNCAAAADCKKLKNALQADPVATGPHDSRFITKAYIGDLDGRIWRFNVKLDAALNPELDGAPTKLWDAGASHPLFSSMATVNVGGTQQYLFQGTGSDLLPSNGVSQSYKLLVVLDNGTSGSNPAAILLEKTDGLAGDEKVTAFPAVAGDIVFFATSTFKPAVACGPNVDANLYAFTFIGGPAYDTTGDGRVTSSGNGSDSVKVRTVGGARATAPFVVDQHLIFAPGNKVEMFGDPKDFNNGVGQAGVRILSWREVR